MCIYAIDIYIYICYRCLRCYRRYRWDIIVGCNCCVHRTVIICFKILKHLFRYVFFLPQSCRFLSDVTWQTPKPQALEDDIQRR